MEAEGHIHSHLSQADCVLPRGRVRESASSTTQPCWDVAVGLVAQGHCHSQCGSPRGGGKENQSVKHSTRGSQATSISTKTPGFLRG